MFTEIGSSIIAFVASYSGMTCEDVFVKTAASASPLYKEAERPYLERFAHAACQTTNPDIIWQLAMNETKFEFIIARMNIPNKKDKIYRGNEAVSLLNRVKENKIKRRNIDIGVMQVNYRWHSSEFNNNPFTMLDPKEQIDYLATKYAKELHLKCKKSWVGCYHSGSKKTIKTRKRAKKYQNGVKKAGKILAKEALLLLKKHTSRKSRPRIKKTHINLNPPSVTKDAIYTRDDDDSRELKEKYGWI